MSGWRPFKKLLMRYAVLVLFLNLITACAAPLPELQRFVSDTEPICSVAVLPFVNDSKFDQGEIVVQRIMVAGLTEFPGLKIAGEGDVRKLYPELRIFPGEQPDIKQMQIIGSRLEVQALIAGKIVEMSQETKDGEINPVLEIHLQVFDAQSGQTLWTTFHRRDGHDFRKLMHFGLINTVSELAKIMAEEIYLEWQNEGFALCEK